ncbi:hypothetical protein G9A89_007006 [Geosiphon pyriformis]|nr:hypothetical protein G9A89_007006 [Geosiphon pyriformis]
MLYVEGQSIKLILDSSSTGSIITRQLIDQLADGATKTPIGKIDDFPFEVNGIITSIKVLVMEATQYQALVEHSGTPANVSRPTHMCSSHVWPLQNSSKREIIDQTGGEEKKAYLRSLSSVETNDLTWTDNNESEPTSSWEWKEDKKNKEKGKEEETTQTTTTYNTYTIPQ